MNNRNIQFDSDAPTQPSRVPTQLTSPQSRHPRMPKSRKNKRLTTTKIFGCLSILILISACLVVFGSLYFLLPVRSNILFLGIDYAEDGGFTGRSDTIILMSLEPFRPYIGMLSIPRDLWVSIPGIGENRINTAHFFAEANQKGSGPYAVQNTIRENFGVDTNYYIRFRFENFREIVDAMGGLDIHLEEPAAGYEAGNHHLTGRKALAFARNRIGSDDFFRMERGQLLIKALIKQTMNPTKWDRIPSVIKIITQSIDTNIPIWFWPRVTLAILRLGVNGIDNQTITREMVTPFTTDQGAKVLLPKWDLIRPVIFEMFQP